MEANNNIQVNPEVINYAKKHGKKQAYLFNNRLFVMHINPSELRKKEYNINWEYINKL